VGYTIIQQDSPLALTVAQGTTVTAFVQAEGDILLGPNVGAQALVEVHLVVDGVVVRSVRTSAVNYAFGNNSSAWHLGTIGTLGPGAHDVHVEARTVAASSTVVSANITPGSLTVALFR
jgi:hypothetical protein